ncbi:hypothetical protein Tco_1253406 [Tanacetum coccineum]
MALPVIEICLTHRRRIKTNFYTLASTQYQKVTHIMDREVKQLKQSGDILGVTTLRDTSIYYPKRYWEILPKEILGDTTQRDIRRYYPKRYWEILPKEILGDITLRDTFSVLAIRYQDHHMEQILFAPIGLKKEEDGGHMEGEVERLGDETRQYLSMGDFGSGYLRKGQKQSQKRQNRARERKEREEKAKSQKVNQSQPRQKSKSKPKP